MRQTRFTEEQTIGILKEADAGAQVRELCRRHGITETTFYRCRKKHGGMDVTDARRLRASLKSTRDSRNRWINFGGHLTFS